MTRTRFYIQPGLNSRHRLVALDESGVEVAGVGSRWLHTAGDWFFDAVDFSQGNHKVDRLGVESEYLEIENLELQAHLDAALELIWRLKAGLQPTATSGRHYLRQLIEDFENDY